MGANRKLQIEIDRTLKKVAEGIDTFDEIWEKVYETDQVSLKEKYEADLKKEIKKLQRYRDTIKTWLGGSEIKDKSTLLEARKAVERQMERFKVCEKETKTKMFSKEGLALAQKQDPKEKARNEMRDWINLTVATLTEQAENFDAEVEQLQPGKKKGKPPPRLVHAEESATRHRAHINRLEQILRLLDNEAIEAEDLEDTKNSVVEYLENNQEEFDFYACPDDLYVDVLEQLDNLEAQQPVAVNHIGKDTKTKENKEREREREKERNAVLAMKLQLAGGGLPVVVEDSSPEKPATAKKAPEARPTPRSIPVPPPPKPETARSAVTDASVGDGASEAHSESAPSTPGRHAQPQAPSARHDPSISAPAQISDEQRQAQGGAVSAAPGAQTPALPAGTPSFAAAAAAAAASVNPARSQPSGEMGVDPSVSSKTDQGREAKRGQQQRQQPGATAAAGVPPPGQAANIQLPSSAAPIANDAQQGALGFSIGRPAAQEMEGGIGGSEPSQEVGKSSEMGEGPGKPPIVPQSNMAELHPSESKPAPGSAVVPSIGFSQTHLHLLSASSRCLPSPADRLWGTKSLQMRLLPNGLPGSYPDTRPANLDSPLLFEKLETEALFYAFYYQPGTYQQYLAARELKRQSWRYHKQHRAWFQRHEEPKTATEEYEQGTYVYFDYNIMHDEMQSGWCYRLKQDFTFRYDALEDDLQA